MEIYLVKDKMVAFGPKLLESIATNWTWDDDSLKILAKLDNSLIGYLLSFEHFESIGFLWEMQSPSIPIVFFFSLRRLEKEAKTGI